MIVNVAVDWRAVLAKLTQPTYRRSWFCKPFEDGYDLSLFVDLLRQVNPERSRELRDRPPIEHFMALGQECAELFPVIDYWIDDLDEGIPSFIPVDLLGCDPWDRGVDSPAIAVCVVAHRTPKDPWGSENGEPFTVTHFECLQDVQRLACLLPAALGERRVIGVRLPPSRQWRKPWEGLRDLFNYATSQTGYGFLDVVDLDESGYEWPEWNIEEIRSLASQWRYARPVFDRAMALRHYIDERPRERLPVLANALLGDRTTLRQITLPRRIV